MDSQLTEATMAAVKFFNETAKKRVAQDKRLHAETVIVSVGRMTGSLLYRSFGLDPTIVPGTAVLSVQAELHGPALTRLLLVTLQQLGHDVGEHTLDPAYATDKYSQLDFRATQELLAPYFLRYCAAAPLTLQDGARAAAITAAMLVHECRAVLSVDKGAAMAVYALVEGSKTAPWPWEDHTPAAVKKPWYKNLFK